MAYRRYIGQEEADVEGHGLRFRDGEGNDWFIHPDRVQAIKVRGEDGQDHEVEGHLYRKLGKDPDVQGSSILVTYVDDDGQAQEVEGHRWHASDLRLKRDVEPLRGALARLRGVGRG